MHFFKHHGGKHPEGGRRHARGRDGEGFWGAWGGHGDHWGRGERGEGFGGRGGRGGAARVFENGDLRFLFLDLIREKPRYGYEIIKAIEEKVGGGYSPSPGVVYPTLTLLEEMGHTEVSVGEGGKKLYTLTESGAAFLEENRHVLAAIKERLDKISAVRGWMPPAPVVRAMENLKMALRLRLRGGTLTEEQARAIAQALDQAAQAIEQA
ncbi:DNA-binding PadR family transcriptional regulator [Nitrospirillum amazonense]|uniref:DNA-binding PadR family transcriptional regulator n=1 Tax=Nitrospirillum amazonense TaxID=28077 RepID=A0A560KHY9_9PROT|nr:PadR family transcriptional regulator [Nitrospirillum amazonense]TWB82836.1 DNA-binding PadR family transcriptional regulator [Nitrospirillum amazonense]